MSGIFEEGRARQHNSKERRYLRSEAEAEQIARRVEGLIGRVLTTLRREHDLGPNDVRLDHMWHAGRSALVEACRRYDKDHHSGAKLTTFAWRWIKGAMLRELDVSPIPYDDSIHSESPAEYEYSSPWRSGLVAGLADQILRRLDAVDPRFAAVLKLKDTDNVHFREIARRWGWHHEKVRRLYADARRTARKLHHKVFKETTPHEPERAETLAEQVRQEFKNVQKLRKKRRFKGYRGWIRQQKASESRPYERRETLKPLPSLGED